jgi:hypothetical protein
MGSISICTKRYRLGKIFAGSLIIEETLEDFFNVADPDLLVPDSDPDPAF